MTRIVETSAGSSLATNAESSSAMAPAPALAPAAALDGALLVSGSPEAVIAAALLALEGAERRQEILRASAFEQRLERRIAAIDDRRRENRLTLAAGLVSGLAELAKGAYELVGAGASEGGGEGDASDGGEAERPDWLFRSRVSLRAVQTGATAGATVLGFQAKEAKLDGEQHDLEATAFEEAEKRAARARDDADASADRMLDGIRELGRLRHEAALAALRG